jgi:hypothetical protein
VADDIDRHLAATRHAHGVAVDVEHFAVEGAAMVEAIGISHVHSAMPPARRLVIRRYCTAC